MKTAKKKLYSTIKRACLGVAPVLCGLSRPAQAQPAAEIVVDNTEGVATGSWSSSSSGDGYRGDDYRVHVPSPTCVTIQRGLAGDVHDTHLSSGNGGWAAGDYPGLWTGLSSSNNWSAFGFELTPIPAGAEVVSATLGVYEGWSAKPGLVRAHRITAEWSEQTASWPNFGGVESWDPATIGTFDALGYGYKSIDVTALVQGWVTGAVPTRGLLLEEEPVANQVHAYFSSESGAPGLRPKLDVCYLASGGDGSVFTWPLPVATAGTYQIFARWAADPGRTSAATYAVTHSQGVSTSTMSQKDNGGMWNLIGTYTMGPGSKVELSGAANGPVVADAVRLVPVQGEESAELYFIHPDHLNTPRRVEDQAGDVVWRWEQGEPFGDTLPNEDADDDGVVFDLPLRLPGQYEDKESKLHYNYARNYDPTLGRYTESDLLGLTGGLNSYAYVGGNPVSRMDPKGESWTVAAVLITMAALGGAFYGYHECLVMCKSLCDTDCDEDGACRNRIVQCQLGCTKPLAMLLQKYGSPTPPVGILLQ